MNSRTANHRLAGKLLLVSAGMFLFGVFAMPPLYAKFCEITGIGQAGVSVAETIPAHPTTSDRSVKIFFDATSNSALPWIFEPVERSMLVNLGEASESAYAVSSLVDENTAGRAVYNVTPPEAARYFVKTECFCFSRQKLAGLESREMPVRFYIDAELPEEIREITLSYTFFLNEEADVDGDLAQRSGSD